MGECMTQKEQRLKSRIEAWTKEQQPLLKTSSLYSWLRLASVILALGLSIYADQTKTQLGFILAGVLLIFFVILVIKHSELKQKLRRLHALISIAEKLIRRIDGSWTSEQASSICEDDDTLSYDLDLFGSASLYEYINMCATPFGKKRLQALLKGEEDDLTSVLKRQKAVKELLAQEEFLWQYESGSILFQEDCMKINDDNFTMLLNYGTTKQATFPKLLLYVSILMAILTLSFLVLGMLSILPYGYCAVLMLLNVIISLLVSGKSGGALSNTKSLVRILKDYQVMFLAIKDCEFHDKTLCKYSDIMKQGLTGIQKLNHVMDLVAVRHNVLSYFLLAALVQIDIPCIIALEAWKRNYGTHMEEWLYAAGEMEALVSLSVIAQVKETICFPELLEKDEPILAVSDACHPLIKESEAVANSVSLTNGSMIITGSNMSGKTTFLRTLGITMMLTRAGAPVCASKMSTTLMEVYTSMRVKDDVKEGISTFYAELLRIRNMMDATKNKKQMLVLIDEIFKGTNSADRILCAKTAITKLHLPWVMTLVSTHDFELCALSEDEQVKAHNYHFSEYYVGDEIKFDYTLKDGRCTSTNAKELMRLAGII